MDTLEQDRLNVPKHGLFLPGFGLLYDVQVPEDLEMISDQHGRKIAPIGGSAFGTSGMYVLNWIDILDATQLAIDLSLTSHRWALYTNTLTPNFSTDVSYSNTNELATSGNYTQGGRDIATGGGSPTVTESPAGTIMYDQADMTWPSATFTARGGILYADALAGNNLIVAQTYGADITATAGTFTVQFNALGVLTLDITP